MNYYKVTLTPRKSPGGRWTTRIRSADIVFTAPDDEAAQTTVREVLTDFFLGTGNDPEVDMQRL